MFYESMHSSKKNFFKLTEMLSSLRFPLHLHECYEFLYVEKGETKLQVGEVIYCVKEGNGILILPHRPHAIFTPAESIAWITIFSDDHVPELKKLTTAKEIFFPVLKPTIPDLYQRLQQSKQNTFRRRAVLYELIATYTEGERISGEALEDSLLVCQILEYITAHYTEPLTLSRMAKELGYSYSYLSGIINHFFKKTLPQLVNGYRIDYACDLLLNSGKEITEIALSCGFGSIRNFNRSFKEVMGIAPQEYLKQKKSAPAMQTL